MAALGLLTACGEASAGVLTEVLQWLAALLSVLFVYMCQHLLPLSTVLTLKLDACAHGLGTTSQGLALIDSEWCDVMREALSTKVGMQQQPVHAFGVDLLLLAWLVSMFWWMWGLIKDSSGGDKRQGLEAAWQRKEARAAQRKLERQLTRLGC